MLSKKKSLQVDSWEKRRAADFRLYCAALEVVCLVAPWSWLAVKAFGVAVVFRLRLALRWHSQPSSWLVFSWHGNYCGPGHTSQESPTDVLDEACLEHDLAYSEKN